MLVRTYYTVNGEILGDSVAGDYMRDALGNVTGTIDRATGQVVNTYRYKPSGELLSKTGTGPDPKFTNVGVHGVRNTGLPHAESDMRARHYSTKEGRFTSVDPLWPHEPAYGYARANPVNNIDPSGLAACLYSKCHPILVIKEGEKKCDAKRHPTKKGVLLIRAYKFFEYHCTMICIWSSDCGACFMRGTFSDKLTAGGSVIEENNDRADWPRGNSSVSGKCPGSAGKTDAPGLHSGGRKEGEPPSKLGYGEYPDTLPIIYNATYKVYCECADYNDMKEVGMSIKIYRKGSGIACEIK